MTIAELVVPLRLRNQVAFIAPSMSRNRAALVQLAIQDVLLQQGAFSTSSVRYGSPTTAKTMSSISSLAHGRRKSLLELAVSSYTLSYSIRAGKPSSCLRDGDFAGVD